MRSYNVIITSLFCNQSILIWGSKTNGLIATIKFICGVEYNIATRFPWQLQKKAQALTFPSDSGVTIDSLRDFKPLKLPIIVLLLMHSDVNFGSFYTCSKTNGSKQASSSTPWHLCCGLPQSCKGKHSTE